MEDHRPFAVAIKIERLASPAVLRSRANVVKSVRTLLTLFLLTFGAALQATAGAAWWFH
jgi:hypothetical protein